MNGPFSLRRRDLLGAGTELLAVVLSTAGCSSSPPPAPPPPLKPVLWGEMKPVVSVKELMKYMIDPIADNIFNAVGTVAAKQGLWTRCRDG